MQCLLQLLMFDSPSAGHVIGKTVTRGTKKAMLYTKAKDSNTIQHTTVLNVCVKKT